LIIDLLQKPSFSVIAQIELLSESFNNVVRIIALVHLNLLDMLAVKFNLENTKRLALAVSRLMLYWSVRLCVRRIVRLSLSSRLRVSSARIRHWVRASLLRIVRWRLLMRCWNGRLMSDKLSWARQFWRALPSCGAVRSFTSRSGARPWSLLSWRPLLHSLLIKDRWFSLSRWRLLGLCLHVVNYLFVCVCWLLNSDVLWLDCLMNNLRCLWNIGGFGCIINLSASLIGKFISFRVPHFTFNIFEFFSLQIHISENLMTVLDLLMRKSESFASDQALDGV